MGPAKLSPLAGLLPERDLVQIQLNAASDPAVALATVCRAVYDPRRDDARAFGHLAALRVDRVARFAFDGFARDLGCCIAAYQR